MSSMTEEVFQDCYDNWVTSTGNQPFWEDLAIKYNYPSAESLRSAFKRERTKRGVEKVANRTAQQGPVVGVMDIETLPIMAYAWKLYDEYISPDHIINDSCMLSWAGKFLGETEVYSDILTPNEAKHYNSKRITKTIRDFMNTCDIIIGHNWDGFDGKVITTELTKHNILPVRYRSIDTYKLIVNNYRLTSKKLSFVNAKFGIRNKISHEGFNLWKRCQAGDVEALKLMREYNEGDIIASEDLFWRIQPYVSNSIPNFGTYMNTNKQVCQCGCDKFNDVGFWYTNLAKYTKLQCSKCGSLHRGRKNLLSTEKMRGLMVKL